jgi:hypothetical protein
LSQIALDFGFVLVPTLLGGWEQCYISQAFSYKLQCSLLLPESFKKNKQNFFLHYTHVIVIHMGKNPENVCHLHHSI